MHNDSVLVGPKDEQREITEEKTLAEAFARIADSGFFRGGYVALRTAVYVAFFRRTFREALAVTTILNIVSSRLATVIFAHHGLSDGNLGLLLGRASCVGAVIAAALSCQMSNL